MNMKKIKRNTVKRIHVVQANLRANRKDNGVRPVFTIQTSSGPVHAHRVEIAGPSVLVNSEKPLKCGARIWIETRAEVSYVEDTADGQQTG